MSKTEYTVEDFMLDPEFRNWVFSPDEEAKAYWESFLEEHPGKYRDVELARRALLNLSRNVIEVSDQRIEQTWLAINKGIEDGGKNTAERRVVPISAESTLKRFAERPDKRFYSPNLQFYRVAAILALVFSLGLFFSVTHREAGPAPTEIQLVYEQHETSPGVKSNLTLQDGSKVILNSGSTLRYIKNFEVDRRELFLTGEAYFEVVKDSLRPFTVKTGHVSTTALGTSFNISAYANESHDVYLLTGRVNVTLDFEQSCQIDLYPGEALSVEIGKGSHKKHRFSEEKVLAWTKKTILFEQTPIEEAIRVLENWYGVKIEVLNRPSKGLLLSGRFVDQTLKGVLEGLSYSARFDFQVDGDRVTLNFDTSS
jgi:transmembrane sensor